MQSTCSTMEPHPLPTLLQRYNVSQVRTSCSLMQNVHHRYAMTMFRKVTKKPCITYIDSLKVWCKICFVTFTGIPSLIKTKKCKHETSGDNFILTVFDYLPTLFRTLKLLFWSCAFEGHPYIDPMVSKMLSLRLKMSISITEWDWF